jgi:DNA/RNA-binding domain of Phe-tRNA-synthetase-like protein
MIIFRYDPVLIERFPTIRGGVILARKLRNGPTPPALAELFRAEHHAAIERFGNKPPKDVPSLEAWRRVFSNFGVDPTKYRSAAEALLRRLTKKHTVPPVNLLVDLGNLISVRYSLPVAFFDRRQTTGVVTVRFSNGNEFFTDLGSELVVHPEFGEVIFVDDARLVSARRWCWRQSDQSAVRDDTTEALITVEGHHAAADQDVQAAWHDLQQLLAEFVPGVELHAALLSPENTEFGPE